MLSNDDIQYIKGGTHPQLYFSDDMKFIKGKIGFTAVYDTENNVFSIINPNDNNFVGIKFTGEFDIEIELEGFTSGFPKLVVLNDLPKKAERHFYTDQDQLIGCVCGPVEEMEFMQSFNIKDYIEEKVVPFLYGQLFFNEYEKWPWEDYSHNTLGILESYANSKNNQFSDEMILRLKRQKKDWTTLENILLSKNNPKGHTTCFCNRKDHIRRCHPLAWEGLKKLYADQGRG